MVISLEGNGGATGTALVIFPDDNPLAGGPVKWRPFPDFDCLP
ncbi:MAG TPA: hypothetical protein VK165_04265 [Azonexus sp.]|nr:hypothetical protein [Azonexus sp.]